MSMNHDFIFFNEKLDEVVIKVEIEDSFLDFIDLKIGFDNNLFSKILTINPSYVDKPYGNLIPTVKGFSSFGIMVVNHYSLSELKMMFNQWIEVLSELETDKYYYDLAGLTEKELNSLTKDELTVLKESYFEKKVLLDKLKCCLDHVNLLNDSNYILKHEGI